MAQPSRVLGATLGLLLLVIVLSACGGAPVAENWPGLTLDGDTIYVISGTPAQVYMLDATDGTEKGTFLPPGEHKGAIWWSPVAVGGGAAYAGFSESGAGSADLYAFDPETGQELWNFQADSLILPAPVYADGIVYFGSSDGTFYALDTEGKPGQKLWDFLSEDAKQGQRAIWASPLVLEGRVYLASMDHHVYCLDAQTGDLIWQIELDGAMAEQPTLYAANGILYVGAYDGRVHAIDAASGELAPGFEFTVLDPETGELQDKAGNWFWSKVLTADDRIYATSLDGWLYALDPDTGEMIPSDSYESPEFDGQEDALRASPVEAGELIIIAAESGKVTAVQNGQQQWVWPSGTPDAGILTTPVIGGDTVYVVQMNGHVEALEAQTGRSVWDFVPPESD